MFYWKMKKHKRFYNYGSKCAYCSVIHSLVGYCPAVLYAYKSHSRPNWAELAISVQFTSIRKYDQHYYHTNAMWYAIIQQFIPLGDVNSGANYSLDV